MAGEICRLVTWNVHGFICSDHRWDPQRALAVLRELDPDLVALQEVDARPCPGTEKHPLEILADGLEATAVGGPTLGSQGNDYGNAVLSRLSIVDVRRHDLSRPGAEARGAVNVCVRHNGHVVRWAAVHLGLRRKERIAQAAQLAVELEQRSPSADVVAVAGDLNAWWPGAREARILERAVGPSPALRTFPSRRPLLRLDRIFVSPYSAIGGSGVADDPCARAASDHLPLWLDLKLG